MSFGSGKNPAEHGLNRAGSSARFHASGSQTARHVLSWRAIASSGAAVIPPEKKQVLN
jgi:hypothetical protein